MSLDYSTDDRSSIKEATRGKPGGEVEEMVDQSTVRELEKSGSSKRSTGSSQLDEFACHAEHSVGTFQAEGVL